MLEVVVAAHDAPPAGRHRQLRALLAERCGVAPHELRIERDGLGKPRLADGALRFSLSRSGGLAAYAFARNLSVGVDIELVRPVPEAQAIATSVFPAQELRAYAALAPAARERGFIEGWTRTEALAKALGGGLVLAREALDAALEGGWVVRSFAPAAGFAGALAWGPAGLA